MKNISLLKKLWLLFKTLKIIFNVLECVTFLTFGFTKITIMDLLKSHASAQWKHNLVKLMDSLVTHLHPWQFVLSSSCLLSVVFVGVQINAFKILVITPIYLQNKIMNKVELRCKKIDQQIIELSKELMIWNDFNFVFYYIIIQNNSNFWLSFSN